MSHFAGAGGPADPGTVQSIRDRSLSGSDQETLFRLLLRRTAAVAPHPDIHLVEPAAVAPVPLRVGGGDSKTLIVLEAVLNSGVTVAADETRNDWGAPQHVCDRAGVEAGQAAGRVIEHRHSSLLHDAVRIQIDGLKRAEVHEGHLLVGCMVPKPLGAFGT